MLLQQGHQEVDRQVDVEHQLILGHADVSDSDVQAQDLKEKLHIELIPKLTQEHLTIFLRN